MIIPRLVVATHNAGKAREFQMLLAAHVQEVVSSGSLGLEEPEENGTSFEENALIKAKEAAEESGCLALADDSGLCVTALGGKPGIYTARWGVGKDMRPGMERIQAELGDNVDRSAHFVCCLALCWPDGKSQTFEGRVTGEIVWPPRGDKGHGYDPVFRPMNETRVMAEMEEDEKNAISHRGNAVRALVRWMEGE